MAECWLPNLEEYDGKKMDWNQYENHIYSIFKNDFIDTKPLFQDKEVNIRRIPMVFDKEDAFFHVTCKEYQKNGDRSPDLRRCERIRWIRKLIENYKCNHKLCDNCDGIKLWIEKNKSSKRIHLLFEEQRYMVVIEERKNYCLLITAFYIHYNNALTGYLKRYNNYKNN